MIRVMLRWQPQVSGKAFGLALCLAFSLTSQICNLVHFYPNPELWWLTCGLICLLLSWPLECLIRRDAWGSVHWLSSPQAALGGLAWLGLSTLVIWNHTRPDSGWTNNLWKLSEDTYQFLNLILLITNAFVLTAVLLLLMNFAFKDDPRSESLQPFVRWRVSRPAVVAATLLLLIAGNSFAFWFVHSEETVYYWDFANYWFISADLASELKTSFAGAIGETLRSLREDDFGPLPAISLALSQAVFGDSRDVYILSIVTCYFPAVYLALLFVQQRTIPTIMADVPMSAVVIPCLLVALSPWFWAATLRGYVGIGGAALGLVVFGIYLSRPAGTLSRWSLMGIGVLLASMILFRRWYSFWVTAFIAVMTIEHIIIFMINPSRTVRSLLEAVRPMIIVCTIICILLIGLALPMVTRVVTSDLSEGFTFWKTQATFLERLWMVIDQIGRVPVGLGLASLVVLCCQPSTRRVAMVTGSMVPIIYLHFSQIQDMLLHHRFLFAPSYLVVTSLALVLITRWIRSRLVALTLICLGAVTGVCMLILTVLPSASVYANRCTPWFPTVMIHPLRRDDLVEFRRMVEAVRVELNPGEQYAVVACSGTLNSSHFRGSDLTLGEPLPRERQLLYPNQDFTSGFPEWVFAADVLIVASPPQIHGKPEGQAIVNATAESLLHRRDIGKAFCRLPDSYRLENHVEVFLYRRERQATPEEIDVYAARLRQAHPDQPRIWSAPRWLTEKLGGVD